MADAAPGRQVTRRVFITGMVQGVGMRPFIALLAREFGIAGTVKNIGSNVEIAAEASEEKINAFIEAIKVCKPEMAEIYDIDVSEIECVGAGLCTRPHEIPHPAPASQFSILPSAPGGVAMLPADFPVCSDCMAELLDKTNRRFRHPFISCAVCGPRYSILERAPYDRDTTSMVDFPMCPECAGEYADPTNRRYHAQTVSCHQCGPHLIYEGRTGRSEREDALTHAITALKSGGIVAVKGVGGYHMACSPHNEQAVQRLRSLKGRELKPFAVMFLELAAIKRHCLVSDLEQELLLSPARPIVLLKALGRPFAPSVQGDALLTGAFLPYTPLQMLLLEKCGELVMTSANTSGRPEIYKDYEMLAMLSREELSGVLHHGRRIVTRLDDSVARLSAGHRQPIRRARGVAPRPITVDPRPCQECENGQKQDQALLTQRAGMEPRPYQEPKNILAYGSDLKSAFCLLRGGEAYMSQYFGDMEEPEVQQAYEANLAHMRKLFSIEPTLAAFDLHPGYHSSRLARASGLPLVGVQHHHAHIASVMAEHGLIGPVIGVAFDGTGYGTDGAVWGGEFLLCDGGSFARQAHLQYMTLAGGDSVAVDARKAALCYCEAAGVEYEETDGAALLRSAIANGINTVQYSGMGRLFDAVSSLLGICHANGYEGQCAIVLENAAHRAVSQGITPLAMDFEIRENEVGMDISASPIIRTISRAGRSVKEQAAAALGFHEAVCRMALGVCKRIRAQHGVSTVALSGGTFQNEIILTGCMRELGKAGFRVFTNNEVPCNDGGLALGQAYVAAMQGRQEA